MAEKPHRFASRASSARPTIAPPSSMNTKEKSGAARAIAYRENSNCILHDLATPGGVGIPSGVAGFARVQHAHKISSLQEALAPFFIVRFCRLRGLHFLERFALAHELRYPLVYIGEHGMVGAQVVKRRHRAVTGDDFRLPVHGFNH